MSLTRDDITTTPLALGASVTAPVTVQVTAGDVVYYHSTASVSSSTKDGTLDPAGTSGPPSIVLTTPKYFASAKSSTIYHGLTAVSVDPLQRTRGLPGLATPSVPDGWASPSTLTLSANAAYFGRFTVTAPVTVSTGAFLVSTGGGTGEHFCVGIYEVGSAGTVTRIATTGSFVADTDSLTRIPFTLTAPVGLSPGRVYFSAFATSDSTALATSCNLTASLTLGLRSAESDPATWTAATLGLLKTSSFPLPSSVASFTTSASNIPFIVFDVS